MIGIDLGATRIKGIALDPEGKILHQIILPTNDGDDQVWKKTVAQTVQLLSEKCGLERSTVGISAPGLPNENYSAIAFMPGRMEGLENYNWQENLGQPTFVLNDAVAALVAEARFGAAKGRKNAVLLTLGTGVGGAILIDGKPYGGAFNKAGHLGHIALDWEADPDVTGMPGSLETCIGNYNIGQRTGGKFTSTHALVEAHRTGDAFASEVWLKSVHQLAVGLASITNILSPEIIVLGGGICEAGDDLFLPLEKFMERYEWRAGGNRAEIVKAEFGDLAGAVGAASFAQSFKPLKPLRKSAAKRLFSSALSSIF